MGRSINGIRADAPYLNDLQAHILKPHGRRAGYHIFIHFTDLEATKLWLAGLNVTSAAAQLESARQFRENGINGGSVICIYLSAKGYSFLKLEDKMPQDEAFGLSMKNRAGLLHDPAPVNWEEGYSNPEKAIHAMLLIADSNEANLENLLPEYEALLAGASATILRVEKGIQLTTKFENDEAVAIEHFGYRDGISQPVFFEEEMATAGDSNGRWPQAAPADIVLVPDPGGRYPDSYGSYLVFRKLEQNVAAFKKAEDQLGKQLFPCEPALAAQLDNFETLDEHNRENTIAMAKKWSAKLRRAGALAIGRFKDGTPVAESDESIGNESNGFDFSDDRQAIKCPFHAHIRKVNPRADNPERALKMRIVRRGITYDEAGRNGDLTTFPEKGVGLLFMSFQSNIAAQFEATQRAANEITPGRGMDPLIGQSNGQIREGNWSEQQWPRNWGEQNMDSLPVTLFDFVKLKGGEYFFAPSLSFLQSLGATHQGIFQFQNSTTMTNFLNPSDWQANKQFFGHAVNYYYSAHAYLNTWALGSMGGGPTNPPPPPPPLVAKSINTLRSLIFYVPFTEYTAGTPPQISVWIEEPDGSILTTNPIIQREAPTEYYYRVTLQPNNANPGINSFVVLRVKVQSQYQLGSTYAYEQTLILPVT